MLENSREEVYLERIQRESGVLKKMCSFGHQIWFMRENSPHSRRRAWNSPCFHISSLRCAPFPMRP